MSWDRFAVMLHQHRAGLKSLLMDQQFVAGIGNLYSDEILFTAGLRYDRSADSLSATEVRPALPAIGRDPGRCHQAPGSTAGRRAVQGPVRGESGTTRANTRSNDREGQPCRRCRNPSSGFAQRGASSTFFLSARQLCQGKI